MKSPALDPPGRAHPRRAVTLVAVAVAISASLGFAPGARAETPPAPSPKSPPKPPRPAARPSDADADAAKVAEARERYEKGAAAYAREDYATAVREFKAAWELSRRPAILFNIARAEGKLGHEEAAISYLKQYLAAVPDADDAAAVRGEIAAREKILAQSRDRARAEAQVEAERRRRAEAEASARKAEEAARKAIADAEEAARRSVRPRWPAWVAFGTGAAFLAGGIALNLVAEQAESRAASGNATLSNGFFDRAVDTRGRFATGFGIAFDIIGVGLIGAGVGLYLWARPAATTTERPRVAWIAPTLGGLIAGGSF